MKILVREVREAIYEPDMDVYKEEDQNVEGVLKVEKQNAADYSDEYMDMLDANRKVTSEVLEEEVK